MIVDIGIEEMVVVDQIMFSKVFCSIDVVEVQSHSWAAVYIHVRPLLVWHTTDEYDPSVSSTVSRTHWHDAPRVSTMQHMIN